MGGQPSTISPREFFVVPAPHGFHSSVSSRDWIGEATKVEDGWIAVKRNKTKPSVLPFDMSPVKQGRLQIKGSILSSLVVPGFVGGRSLLRIFASYLVIWF